MNRESERLMQGNMDCRDDTGRWNGDCRNDRRGKDIRKNRGRRENMGDMDIRDNRDGKRGRHSSENRDVRRYRDTKGNTLDSELKYDKLVRHERDVGNKEMDREGGDHRKESNGKEESRAKEQELRAEILPLCVTTLGRDAVATGLNDVMTPGRGGSEVDIGQGVRDLCTSFLKLLRHDAVSQLLTSLLCVTALLAGCTCSNFRYTPWLDVFVYCAVYGVWMTHCLPWVVTRMDAKNTRLVLGVLLRLFASDLAVMAWGHVRGDRDLLQRSLRLRPLVEPPLTWLPEVAYSLRFGVAAACLMSAGGESIDTVFIYIKTRLFPCTAKEQITNIIGAKSNKYAKENLSKFASINRSLETQSMAGESQSDIGQNKRLRPLMLEDSGCRRGAGVRPCGGRPATRRPADDVRGERRHRFNKDDDWPRRAEVTRPRARHVRATRSLSSSLVYNPAWGQGHGASASLIGSEAPESIQDCSGSRVWNQSDHVVLDMHAPYTTSPQLSKRHMDMNRGSFPDNASSPCPNNPADQFLYHNYLVDSSELTNTPLRRNVFPSKNSSYQNTPEYPRAPDYGKTPANPNSPLVYSTHLKCPGNLRRLKTSEYPDFQGGDNGGTRKASSEKTSADNEGEPDWNATQPVVPRLRTRATRTAEGRNETVWDRQRRTYRNLTPGERQTRTTQSSDRQLKTDRNVPPGDRQAKTDRTMPPWHSNWKPDAPVRFVGEELDARPMAAKTRSKKEQLDIIKTKWSRSPKPLRIEDSHQTAREQKTKVAAWLEETSRPVDLDGFGHDGTDAQLWSQRGDQFGRDDTDVYVEEAKVDGGMEGGEIKTELVDELRARHAGDSSGFATRRRQEGEASQYVHDEDQTMYESEGRMMNEREGYDRNTENIEQGNKVSQEQTPQTVQRNIGKVGERQTKGTRIPQVVEKTAAQSGRLSAQKNPKIERIPDESIPPSAQNKQKSVTPRQQTSEDFGASPSRQKGLPHWERRAKDEDSSPGGSRGSPRSSPRSPLPNPLRTTARRAAANRRKT